MFVRAFLAPVLMATAVMSSPAQAAELPQDVSASQSTVVEAYAQAQVVTKIHYSKKCGVRTTTDEVAVRYRVFKKGDVKIKWCYVSTPSGNDILKSFRVTSNNSDVRALSWARINIQNAIPIEAQSSFLFGRVKKGSKRWVELPDGGVVCYTHCTIAFDGQVDIRHWSDPSLYLMASTAG